MKKIISALAALLFAATILEAAPAYPYPIKYTQPDGSTITVQLHGDEFYHYTTSNGQVVALNKDGFYRPSAKPFRRYSEFEQKSKALRSSPMRIDRKASITEGKKKFLVILVEFPDMKFSVSNPKQAFTDLLNKKGYSENGATGSAYDYYYENSSGQFDPSYVVVGPYTVSKGYAEYGGNENESDKNPDEAFYEACVLAQSGGLDFSQFDNDGDGYVDNVFFYYAGHNEAEGGGEDTIWPHASALYRYSFISNGVRVYSYACTSEYRGRSGTSMCGIGTFCHEFGHVLGLPDFYDTDYEEHGEAKSVYVFSLMNNGSYNNNGCTPPYLSVIERSMLGWMDFPDLATEGSYELAPVHQNKGMRTPTSVDGEFFIYEVRDATGWDAAIPNNPEGLLIYHVDMSSNLVESAYKASSLWNNNKLNCYSSHPCYYLEASTFTVSDYRKYTFPGPANTVSFEGLDWSKSRTGYVLSNITLEYSGSVSFNLDRDRSKTISGKVTASDGTPLKGVKVSATVVGESSIPALRGRSLISIRELDAAAEVSTTTDAEGKYSITIENAAGNNISLNYSLTRYQDYSETVEMVTSSLIRDVTLYNITEAPSDVLKKCGSPYTAIGFSNAASTYSATCGVRFSASELANFEGYQIKTISYHIRGSASQVDVFVDFGEKRVLTRQVGNPKYNQICTVDISDAGIYIPEGQDVIIGYAVKDNTTQYFMSIDGDNPVSGGGIIRSGYQTEGSSSWQELTYNFIISADIEKIVSPFGSMGIKIISNPAGAIGYNEGTVFTPAIENPDAGETASKTEWYFDGTLLTESSITLNGRGRHTIKAVLTYADGTTEEIDQVILVK